MRFHLTTLITALVVLISFTQAVEVDDEGYMNLSIGVRMKRDESSAPTLEKRSGSSTSTPLLLRRSPETGKLVWPGSFSEALTMAKRDVPDMLKSSLHRRASTVRRAMHVVITWYTGHDLLNPSCFADSDNWAPTDDSMVAAVTIEWDGKPKCGAFVRIQHHSNKEKHITVRVVDTCAGCPPGQPHLDLTKAAFDKLYDEDVGVVEGLKAKVIPCPKKIANDWNDHVIGRYGPKEPIAYMT
ncbi:hypothetical protein MJO28_008210 [Puccinia striiformis f. sp. tritici]|uniref:RlpA-like protein double-psi beta-barrel domain-containing protein n=4 Tax=Puccinia striiformis TaxID=27350 RepID=A0A0L0VFK9_9BASI|nr:hypothetical protein Pst134EA_015730 [Puccinia striiformis f. sp. tritici]KAI9602570.1 hypothetical protein H4Q26_001860 [Puccinia striiformis f. sp. tritici PST-130]KNE98080.1 hypothetical protein PSTG_08754 [Puccinia striiformis f. sp. tritici PST-78]POW13404.1 hypothetical protein PSTT_03843 [Puccinia striiformis]KAH9452873.1 hypothetical protein Pst134EB_016824 [Puccinia striiformis f. sp. tritici]KAH9463645.1 hypothetical protein Pst134EA_015730 [Puccinia striiformis f. sp. tritici]